MGNNMIIALLGIIVIILFFFHSIQFLQRNNHQKEVKNLLKDYLGINSKQ